MSCVKRGRNENMSDYEEILELFQVAQPKGHSLEEVEAAEERAGKMPAELRKFFLRFGKSPELRGLQDELVLPDCVHSCLEGEYVIFFVENQGVCMAGVKKSDACIPDPPVYVSVGEGEWKKSADSVSEFLKGMYGYQASICLPYNTEEFYWITHEEKELIERKFTKRPEKIKNWLYEWDIIVFGDNNEGRIALMENGGEDVIQMQYAANTEKELQRMREYLESVGEPI